MSNTKPHENLYNALNQQGYDIGDLEQFTEKLKDAQKRHALYDTISTEFNVGDFDNFESAINYLWSNEDTQPISPSLAIPQPLQENIALAKSNPMDKVNPALRTQSTKPIGDVQASQNIGNKAALTFKDVESMPEASAVLQRNADATTSQDAIQQAVSQDLIDQAASQEWQRDTLNSVSGMREEAKKKIKERAEELRNSGEDFDYSQWQQSPSQYGYAPMTTPGVKAPNLHSDREMNLYRLTIETLNEAQKHMETVRENQSRNGFQQAAAGIGDAIFDIDTLTLGLDSLSKNATLKAILDKADADQPLTQAEESLLNAALYKQFTEAALPNGRWYNVGRSIGEQVPYMLEFALSGGVAGALTKGASKAIGKQVVKYINNLALKNGSKIANRTARNVFTRGSRMLGNTLYQLPGGVMRAAAQVPLQSSVYNDIIERQIGTLGYNPGEKGALDYTGRIGADNTADAITKGLISGFITNLTESSFGEGIQFITNKIGGLMGKGANAVFKNLQSPRWYNRLRESFRRNGFGEFVKATSWQGPVAEYGEEILDQTLNAIFVGDSSLDPNSENYVFDLDNLIDTAITTGAISLFMGAAGGIASGKIHRDVNKAFAQAKKNIDTLHYTDTEINALNNIATSRPQEASKWVSSITRTMRTLAIRSAEIENSLSPEARTLLAQPYTDAEFNELSPYDQQAVLALAEINSRFNDLTIQRDYVVAGINYNALSKGLKESVAPQAEAAMADIQANALRDSDYTINVRFKGQDGYLVSGTAEINDLPDGRTVATLPAGNIYQVRTKSPDGQWIIQQAVAEDIVPGTVTPTQQIIDETTARIYTPVQNLINAEQAQAQAEVAQSNEQPSTPTGLNAPIGLNDSPTNDQVSDQVSDQVATPPSGLNTPTATNSSPTSDQVSDQVATTPSGLNAPTAPNGSPTSEQVSDQVSDQVATPPTGLNTPTALNGSSGSTLSTEAQPLYTEAQPLYTEAQPLSTISTQAKLAHIASWQQAIDVPIVIFHDISEVDNPQAVANIQAGNTTPGWITNGTVYIYLPHAKDERDIDATIMHECIAHFGIPRLFATQEQADAFYNEVWNAMPEADQYRFLRYPGVSHLKGEEARRAAADEYIAHLAEQIRAKRAGEAEVSLWQRIVAFFRNALRRANVNLRLNDNDLTQLLLQSLDALKKNNEQPQDTTSDNALDPNDVAVTLPSNGTETRFSIRSFREEGRAKVTNWLDSKVADKEITRQEAQDIIDQLDTIYDICQEYTTQYAPFGDWSEAQVNVDANGNPILSVIKSNNDYAMNLDFSLVCKKRRTLDAVFQEMIARDIINDFKLDGVQVAKINEIIRSYGFETACRLCFVDAKRFRIAAVADTFVKLYNEISSMSDRDLRKILSAEPKTVRGKAAKLLLNDPSQRIKVSRSDFMSAEGFERIKRDYPEIMKLYNSKKGSGGPKASFGDVQYLNDIEDTSWTPDNAYAVGGVRLQSFSDYVPRMVFDYVQMIADLAAKHLPVHAYTKEDIFAKQFGLTGIKINLSLVPRVDPDGSAPGLDRDGNYVWQEGETFPYDTAIAIQNAPGYRDNCGTIAVGVSDAHILKMLDDENIRMVIPYHKSGLNPAVAKFNQIGKFVDYTLVQSTRYANGKKLSTEDLKTHFNFNEALRMANGNPRIAAQQYLDWCRQNNYLPKFDKFAEHPNYYKLLEDFTTMYTVDGVDTVVPQHAVEMRFPTEQDAFGSMRNLIAEGLEADAILEGQRNEQLSAIVDEIAATLPTKTQAKTTDTRFRIANQNQAIFVSNARQAVENIRQDRATPEQWLAMLQKNGGIKAGEDKWLGLSDWLKTQKGSINRQQILDFIDSNEIRIEEVHYSQFGESLIDQATRTLESEIRQIGWDAMQKKYPGIEELFEYDGRELLWSENLASIGEYEDFILDNNITGANSDHNAINETREQYTTPGLTDNHEIALTIPGIEPYKEYDDIHFGDAGGGRAIAWIRFGDTSDSNGNPVLVIDEIQSKRHQDGREKGYRNETEYRNAVQLREQRAPVIRRRLSDISDRLSDISDLIPSDIKGLMNRIKYRESMPEYAEWKRLKEEQSALQAELQQIERTILDMSHKLVPDAPFDKNWHELAFKRMLRYAAENGYNHLAWTTGTQQAERYDIGNTVHAINRDETGILAETSSGDISIDFDSEGNIKTGQFSGNTLAEVFGKETAVKILNMTPGQTLSGDNLRIGGEGMKAFYDRMLPSFASKYIKKWGSKVQDITLPELGDASQSDGLTMHSVEITPDMRESVMQGQTMFRSINPGESLTDYARAVAANGQQTTTPTGLNAPVALASANDKNKLPGTPIRFRMTRRTESTVTGWINRRTDLTPDERKAVIDHIDKLNAKQPKTSQPLVDIAIADTRFRITKRTRETINTWLNKRTDLNTAERNAFWTYIENEEPAKQLAMGKWFANGAIRLPEDQPTVDDAMRMARKMNVDPLKYNAPGLITSEYHERFGTQEQKETLLSPDDERFAGILTNKVDYGNGITVYTVQDDAVGQDAVRELMNDHLGKNFNCWCLLYADANGNITQPARSNYWRHYNSVPKRVAFKDDKICSFCASDKGRTEWWDLSDQSHGENIPVEMELPGDSYGRRTMFEFNESTNEFSRINNSPIFRGNKKNGLYEEWYNEDTHSLALRANYKGGKLHGLHEEWHENGQLYSRTTFKEGKVDGIYEEWHENGQLYIRTTFKESKKDGLYEEWFEDGQLFIRKNYSNGTLDGLYEQWHSNGQMYLRTNYKLGSKDGLFETWYNNGQRRDRSTYTLGNKDGIYEEWYENGQIRSRKNYANDHLKGLYETWHDNGQLAIRTTYKDGNKDGIYEEWHENGQLHIREMYKNGKREGLFEAWDEDGQLKEKANFKNNLLDGLYEEWFDDGQPYARKNYVNDKLNGLSETWHVNGQLATRINYINGNPEGLYEEWYEDGQIKLRKNFKDGKLNGYVEKWDKSGHLIEKSQYVNGERLYSLPITSFRSINPDESLADYARAVAANGQQATTTTDINAPAALASANDKNKLPDTPIRFRMTRRTESTVTGWINRRTDLTPDERKAVIDHIDNLDGTTLQLATAKWFAQGTIRIPEDNIQVEQAIKVASRAKVDPLAYDYPQAIISAFPDMKPKGKPINPDDVPTLTNKQELPNDIVVYDVDNSEESMRNMREIINTHLGVDANPWCILQANKDGILTDTAHRLWRTGYNSLPRRVAFHNGRLIAFFATGNSTQPIWWDRQDLPHIGIPFGREAMNDGSGRYIYNFFNEETGEIYHEKPHSGNRQNGVYREWDNNGNLIEESHYSNGRLNGIQKQWDYTRNTQHPDYTETSYVDGNTDGYQISKDWLSNKGLYITSFATIRNGSLHGIVAESAMRSYSSYVINNNFVSQEEWDAYLKDHPEEKEWFNEAVSHNPISSDEDADTADDVINTQSGTRFRVVEDADTRERFDREIADGNFVKTYRSMVLIDGELYPPMFSKTEKGNKSNPGQLRQPSHEGDIEQSEEDLSKATLKNGKYYITLIKDNNKETRDVAYNPYLHTASSPLNDQFKEAQDRPNMVTVEMYIPISELTNGYQAEGAHDPVGWKPWPSGILRKFIDKPRKVLLTQRGMVHRIVPDSEVASLIDSDINGNLHTLPTNVFTPSVRAELEKLGYRFINTNNAGKITDGQFAGLTYSAAVAQDPEYFGYNPNPTPPKGGKSKESTSFRSINPGESLTDYARAVVANNQQSTNPKDSIDPIDATRFRSIAADNRTADTALDTIEQATADYADSLNAEREAILDAITPAPGDSLRTIAEKTRLRSIGGELITRDNTELEDFLALANNISNAMADNDARHKHTAIAESQYDSMQRLHNLIDDLRKQGALIDDRFDPWLTQNQARSRAQAETKVFDLTYRQPLYEAIARGIRALFPGINTKDKAENAKGYSHLSLYAQARTAIERQEIKSAQARAEAEEKGEEYKERDFGGLAGIQEAIFGLYSAIDNDVEAVKGNIEKLTALATERGIPTVQEYIDNAEAKLGNPDTNGTAANQLWNAIRSISAYQLTYSYNAGLTSRAGYQTLTYGRNIDALLREKYDKQVKQIKDNPGSYDNVTDYDKDGNATGTRKVLNDNARIALSQLNQEYAEAIDAVPMPGKNGSWQHLIDTGWLTEEDVNSLHRYYMYYMPLKGHAELTAEDIVDYENKTPRNLSKIKAVEGHSHLAKDPFNQLILDTHGAIQNAEQNRWRLNLYNILTNNPNPSQYVVEQRFYKIETQSDGSKEYVPYGELKTINGAQVFIPGRPTAEELANGTAVSYNNRFTRAEVDIPIRNDQRKEHSVTVMVDGEAYNMFFYDKRIADAINGTNIKRPSEIWKQLDKLQALNRLYAGLKTSLNPTFTLISNLPRDWMEMASNNLIEHGLEHAVTSFIYRVRATRVGDVQAALRKYQDGKLLTLADATTDVERYVVEFFNNGGSVNITQLPDYNTAKVELMDDLNTYMRTGEMPKGSWLSRNFNNMAERVELAPRLATYIASRTLGRNISQSVNDAKEATVNFDRKGSWSGIMGMMQLFYNAAAQSVRRQIGLARRHPVRFATTYATIGLLSPLNNIMMSYIMSILLGDDDDLETIVRNYFAINPELRRRYNIILIGNDYIRIPMAVNYLPYVTLGDAIANWRLNPNYRPNVLKDTLDIAAAILDTFLPSMIAQPIGFMFDAITAQNNVESANASRAIVFSLLNKIPVIEPLIQAVGNYNFMGSTLFDMPYDKNSQEPAYLRARQYTQPVWVWASHLLNDITGGNEVHAGWLNIAPEQIENVMTVFGGYGEYAENIISIGIETVSILSGEKPDTEVFKKSFPLLSRLYGGNTQERYDKSMQSMFYDDTTALAGFNEYRKNATTASTRADFDRTYSPDEQRYFADLNTMESIAKKIRKEIKAATPEGEAPKYHEDERLKAIYNLANEQYHSLASGEYKPIDNPYYTYMYIKDAIEKAPHRTTDGTYRLIDRSDRSADSRGHLKQLLQSFSKTRSMHNALPSGYYPGMPLDNREEQALNRFNIAVGELIQAYKNTDLDNLTPTDNAQ